MRAPTDEAEHRAAGEMLRRAFDWPAESLERWAAARGEDPVLAVFVGDEVAAASRVRPFGQFFGGRSVPMGGFSPVGAAPEYRGRGYASAVTAAQYPAMREQGQALAALYPASTRLYRGLGFEVAGAWSERHLPARSLQQLRPPPGVGLRRATRDDLPAVRACYARAAARANGMLDRPEAWWRRILDDRWDEQHVYAADGDAGALDGYVAYRHGPDPTWGYSIHVQEVVAERAEVALALWRLVGSSSTMARDVTFNDAPETPLLFLLPEQDVTERKALRWMLRVVDAPAAIAARGFPPGVAAAVDLEVDDRHCDWNAGRWRLEVGDGRAVLARGGAGSVRLGAGALASLYSGYASAVTLARAGLLAGDDRDLAGLDAAFAGPTPWMLDFF